MHPLKFLRLKLLTYNFAILLVGCTAPAAGLIIMSKPAETKLSNFKTMSVQVGSQISDKPGEDLTTEIQQLENLIIAQMKRLNQFQKVFRSTQTDSIMPDLQLKAIITKIKKLSGESREWWGGRGEVTLSVSFIETSNSQVIGSCRVEGKSAKKGGVTGGTVEALLEAAKQIAVYVKQN